MIGEILAAQTIKGKTDPQGQDHPPTTDLGAIMTEGAIAGRSTMKTIGTMNGVDTVRKVIDDDAPLEVQAHDEQAPTRKPGIQENGGEAGPPATKTPLDEKGTLIQKTDRLRTSGVTKIALIPRVPSDIDIDTTLHPALTRHVTDHQTETPDI